MPFQGADIVDVNKQSHFSFVAIVLHAVVVFLMILTASVGFRAYVCNIHISYLANML